MQSHTGANGDFWLVHHVHDRQDKRILNENELQFNYDMIYPPLEEMALDFDAPEDDDFFEPMVLENED